jgi:Putative addiction module component
MNRSDEQPPFNEAWRAVIQRRSNELLSGQVMPIPWTKVKRQAREKASGRRLIPARGSVCRRSRD